MPKKMMLMAGFALATALALPAMAEDKPTATTVVARVNGTDITLGELSVLLEKLPAQYQSMPDDALFKGLLDQAIQQTLLAQSLKGPVSAHDTLVIDTERRAYLAGIALQPVVKAAVTDQALQAAYDARFKDAAPQTEYHAQHILVDSEDKAKDLKAKLDAGGDFAELAKANSTDTGSAANGGDLGWFGTGMMVKPFEDAVVAAKVGEVTGPIKTDFGWHLIKVTETRIAAKPTLDSLKDELTTEIQQNTIDSYLKSLESSAKIEKPGEGLDPKLIRDATLFAQ